MLFWDSSALFPLVVRELHTSRASAIFMSDRRILASFITPIELSSAIWRRRHHKSLTAEQGLRADHDFAALSYSWISVGDTDDVIATAISVVSRHALRTGDALQLAAAVVARDEVGEFDFVTFDRRLAVAARAEGFSVVA
jgi:predicted nucleic acid-binding protein